MRTGIISDIHSNLQAAEAVLKFMKNLSIDRYICLGDLVGYGGNPVEVVEMVRPPVEFTVMGNHDAAVAGRMDYTYYYDAARRALDWTRNALKREQLQYLSDLPLLKVNRDVCYVHGEPMVPGDFNYIYTIDHAEGLCPHYDDLQTVTFVGHSHLRRVYEIRPDIALEYPVESMILDAERKYVVAVGSVGQPRDFDTRACCVVWDDEKLAVEFYRIEYDIDGAAQAILSAGLPEYFAARLYSGS